MEREQLLSPQLGGTGYSRATAVGQQALTKQTKTLQTLAMETGSWHIKCDLCGGSGLSWCGEDEKYQPEQSLPKHSVSAMKLNSPG